MKNEFSASQLMDLKFLLIKAIDKETELEEEYGIEDCLSYKDGYQNILKIINNKLGNGDVS